MKPLVAGTEMSIREVHIKRDRKVDGLSGPSVAPAVAVAPQFYSGATTMYSLLDLIPASELAPVRVRIPQRIPRPTSYQYVREIRPGLWQARPWLGVRWIGSVNLGLYQSERAAHLAVKQWVNAGADPCRGLPDGILPKFVRADKNGRGYYGSVRMRGVEIRTAIFTVAADAHHEMVRMLDERFKPRSTPRQLSLDDLACAV